MKQKNIDDIVVKPKNIITDEYSQILIEIEKHKKELKDLMKQKNIYEEAIMKLSNQ